MKISKPRMHMACFISQSATMRFPALWCQYGENSYCWGRYPEILIDHCYRESRTDRRCIPSPLFTTQRNRADLTCHQNLAIRHGGVFTRRYCFGSQHVRRSPDCDLTMVLQAEFDHDRLKQCDVSGFPGFRAILGTLRIFQRLQRIW